MPRFLLWRIGAAMTEHRYGYTYHRVLIDSTRVLDPQFHDAVIYVTGAQLELLRNMTQYLNRLSTYVSEYHPDYYLSPTIEDYDIINAIVADLEETLMGNPNVIWGYSDNLWYRASAVAGSDATKNIGTPTIAEGELWVISKVSLHRTDNADNPVRLTHFGSLGYRDVADYPIPAVNTYYDYDVRSVLKAGEALRFGFTGATTGETVTIVVLGYQMVVPIL
jgi:hypothetical protein